MSKLYCYISAPTLGSPYSVGRVKKKLFLKMNYLRAKNENIAKNRLFCEKISSLG